LKLFWHTNSLGVSGVRFALGIEVLTELRFYEKVHRLFL